MRFVWHQHRHDERGSVQVSGLRAADLPLFEVPQAEQPLQVPRLRVHGTITMGKVAAKIKIMPQSPEVDLDALQERLEGALPEGAKIKGFERDDVAFGLVALFPTVIIPDEAGGTDAVEGVESVDVDTVGRL